MNTGKVGEANPGASIEASVVGFQPYGSSPMAEKAGKSWIADGNEGYHGVIELDDEKFYYRDLSRHDLRAFSEATRQLQRDGKRLEQQQAQELEKLRTEMKRAGEDPAYAELSDERLDYYDSEGDKIADALNAAYVNMLQKGIVAWSLPEKYDPILLAQFSMADKVALCQELASRSVSGLSSAKK